MKSNKKWLGVVAVVLVIGLPLTIKALRGEKGTEVRLAYDDIEKARTVFEWGGQPKPGRGSGRARAGAGPATKTKTTKTKTKKAKAS